MSTIPIVPRWNWPVSDDNNSIHHKSGTASKSAGKRRRSGRDDEYLSQPRQMAEHHRNKSKAIQERRIKRARTPLISGQRLPVNRLVELLDKSQLKTILEAVMAQHPEVAQTIQKCATKPSPEAIINLIQEKAAQIAAHLPYKCDVESDYSYIRVKPFLTEFLDCISDFILDLLPPMDSVLPTSCFILHTITTLIHELPNFSNNEYQYTKAVAYQQLANLWLTLLTRHQKAEEGDSEDANTLSSSTPEPPLEWLKTVESMKLLEHLEKHNEASEGKFAAVVDYLKVEIGNHPQFAISCSPEAVAPQGSIFNDLITVDYSNYSIATNTSR